jgi:hypothetical protein
VNFPARLQVALCAITIQLPPMLLSMVADSATSEYHLGEGGSLYPLQSVADKSSWQYGKIHPDLFAVPFDGVVR